MKPKFPLTEEVKTYLEHRMGPSLWDGVFFDGKGISSGHFSLTPDAAGQRIQNVMELYATVEEMLGDDGSLGKLKRKAKGKTTTKLTDAGGQ